MKKVNLLLVVLFALTLGFVSSCTPEEADKPTIVVTEVAGATYALGSVVTYEVILSSNADLKTFTASPSVVGGDGTGVIVTNPVDAITDGNFVDGLNSVTITYAYAVPATGIAAGSEISIEFYVSDDVENETVTKTLTELIKMKLSKSRIITQYRIMNKYERSLLWEVFICYDCQRNARA